MAQSPFINILLLGETGVGKSTFINSFASYLTSDDYEAAARALHVLIPTEFDVVDVNDKSIHIELGTPDSNENLSAASSATQGVQTYTFPLNNGSQIRLIDSPGLGDTRGQEQDGINCHKIVSYLKTLEEIHAICFFFKSNLTRLTDFFRYCFTEILCRLEKSVVDNIVFIFTNCRTAFFTPGDSTGLLKKMLDEITATSNIKIPFDSAKNCFCFDNETFRLLGALHKGIPLKEEVKRGYIDSWTPSVKSSKKLLAYVLRDGGIKAHKLKDTIAVNESRRLFLALVLPLNDVSLLISDYVKILCEYYKNKTNKWTPVSLDRLWRLMKLKQKLERVRIELIKTMDVLGHFADTHAMSPFKHEYRDLLRVKRERMGLKATSLIITSQQLEMELNALYELPFIGAKLKTLLEKPVEEKSDKVVEYKHPNVMKVRDCREEPISEQSSKTIGVHYDRIKIARDRKREQKAKQANKTKNCDQTKNVGIQNLKSQNVSDCFEVPHDPPPAYADVLNYNKNSNNTENLQNSNSQNVNDYLEVPHRDPLPEVDNIMENDNKTDDSNQKGANDNQNQGATVKKEQEPEQAFKKQTYNKTKNFKKGKQKRGSQSNWNVHNIDHNQGYHHQQRPNYNNQRDSYDRCGAYNRNQNQGYHHQQRPNYNNQRDSYDRYGAYNRNQNQGYHHQQPSHNNHGNYNQGPENMWKNDNQYQGQSHSNRKHFDSHPRRGFSGFRPPPPYNEPWPEGAPGYFNHPCTEEFRGPTPGTGIQPGPAGGNIPPSSFQGTTSHRYFYPKKQK